MEPELWDLSRATRALHGFRTYDEPSESVGTTALALRHQRFVDDTGFYIEELGRMQAWTQH